MLSDVHWNPSVKSGKEECGKPLISGVNFWGGLILRGEKFSERRCGANVILVDKRIVAGPLFPVETIYL
jgi:hypothetical protein